MVTLSRVSDFLWRYRQLNNGACPPWLELSESELRGLIRECEGTHCVDRYAPAVLGIQVHMAEG